MLEQPNHGMNWSPNSKKSFANTIDRSKDFTKVASTMDNKTKGDCQAYYYSSFKCTREYMELKRSTQKKESSSRRSTITTRGSRRCSSSGNSSNNDDNSSNDDENNSFSSPQRDTTLHVDEPWTGECTKCKGDGELLCCDGCDSMFHLRCAALEHVPSGNWFCEECIARRGVRMHCSKGVKKSERERGREK